MFERLILRELEQWRQQKKHKPLILRGARQVGKTTAVDAFGERFDQYLSFNLDQTADRQLFDQELPFEQLVAGMFFSRKQSPHHSNTLIFIDEIQNSSNAIHQLRYFYEQMPELYVIAAGSLLEVALQEESGGRFPVGRVEYRWMYPCSFEEYLIATDAEHLLQTYHTLPLPEYAHFELMQAFHQYTLLGGMPEVLEHYQEHEDLSALNPVYEGLLNAYLSDIVHYAKNATMHQVFRYVIETAPLEAGKRITFENFGSSTYRSREVGEVLRTLERAMLLQLTYPTTLTELPITPNLKKLPRLQFLDTGLMNYFLGLQAEFFQMKDLHSLYRGTLAEHIVGQELQAQQVQTSRKLSFWVRDKPSSSAEIDFVIPYQGKLIPIEVKAGRTGTLKSLHLFMDQCPHDMAVRLYAGPLKIEETSTPKGTSYRLLNLPYALTGKLEGYLEWMTG